jgi:DNA-binding response OmpR family regulator
MSYEKRILVIDDDIGMADLLGDFCEALGFEVRCVTDARDSLRAAIEFRPHLITLDLEMPFVNGYEVLRQLRGHPATNGTPVMIVSGMVDETRLGSSPVKVKLIKPVRYSVFAKNLQGLLESGSS